jgi:hypothetical protein
MSFVLQSKHPYLEKYPITKPTINDNIIFLAFGLKFIVNRLPLYLYRKIYLIKNFWIDIMTKKEVLVIVAHPDDETIWVGGTLLQSKDNKTIISLCRKKDRDRAPRFRKVCKLLQAKAYILDLDDAETGKHKEISSKEIIKRILKITKNKKYDILYTHGKEGEYGHKRHLDIHKAVNEMLDKKLLSAKEVFFFSYHKMKNNFQDYALYNSSADKLIRLKAPYFRMKKKLITEVYGFQKGGFEEKSSRNIEAFDIKK